MSNMGFARRKLNPAPGGAVSWPLRHVGRGLKFQALHQYPAHGPSAIIACCPAESSHAHLRLSMQRLRLSERLFAEALGLQAFRAFECTFGGRQLIQYRDTAHSTITLEAAPGANLDAVRSASKH